MTDKLTPAAARAILPGDVLKCEKVPGLELVGRSNGGASWRLYYRSRDGLQRRPTIGRFPQLQIDGARDAARDILAKVAAGADPSRDWQELRAAPTVADLCERFKKQYLPKKAPATRQSYTEQIDRDILPSPLAKMRVADVTFDDVEALLEKIRARGALTMANRVRSTISRMFTLAETAYRMKPQGSHPVKGTTRAPEKARKRHATPQEIGAIAAELRQWEAVRPLHVAALYTLFFTGARKGEVLSFRWDMCRGTLLERNLEFWLTEHKTAAAIGDKAFRLPDPALDVLARLPPVQHEKVFGGVCLRKTWAAVRKAAGCPDLEIRDIRRTFATAARTAGVKLDVIGKHFGHTQNATTERYAYIFDDTVSKAAAETAEQMRKWMGSI